jgi:hypothetical protein
MKSFYLETPYRGVCLIMASPQVLSKRGSFVARLKELLHPSPDWGPLMPIDKWHRKNFLGVGGRGEDEDDIS